MKRTFNSLYILNTVDNKEPAQFCRVVVVGRGKEVKNELDIGGWRKYLYSVRIHNFELVLYLRIHHSELFFYLLLVCFILIIKCLTY